VQGTAENHNRQSTTLTVHVVKRRKSALHTGVFLDGIEDVSTPVAIDLIASHAVQDKQTLHGFRSQEAVASPGIHVRALGIKPGNFRRQSCSGYFSNESALLEQLQGFPSQRIDPFKFREGVTSTGKFNIPTAWRHCVETVTRSHELPGNLQVMRCILRLSAVGHVGTER
jgi:hypothetical protein